MQVSIKINGITVEDYQNLNKNLIDFIFAVESMATIKYDMNFDNYNVYEDNFVETALENTIGHVLANEDSVAWDAIKNTAKVARSVGKAVGKGYGASKQTWKATKLNWVTKYKPLLLKVFRLLGDQMTKLWNVFKQYDKRYQELGKKIPNINKFFSKSMGSIPDMKITYHEFDAGALAGCLKVLESYETFSQTIYTDKYLFNGQNKNMDIPTITNAIKTNKPKEILSAIDTLNAGLARFNQFGELTLPYLIWNSDGYRKWFINKVDAKIIKDAVKQKVTVSEFVKTMILRNQVVNKYTSNNIHNFKQDMFDGKRGFLNLVESIINNSVLQKTLEKSGGSIKKETDNSIRELSEAINAAKDMAKKSDDTKKANAKENDNPNEQKELTGDKKIDKEKKEVDRELGELTQEAVIEVLGFEAWSDLFQRKSNVSESELNKDDEGNQKEGTSSNQQTDNSEQPQDTYSVENLAGVYLKLWIQLQGKMASCYSNIARGVLAASYEIIKEAEACVNLIEQSMKPAD